MTSDVENVEIDVARAADVLRAGGLVAFPTETVYGLGANASSPDAMRRLYAVKGRPSDHPVIVHLAHADAIDAWAAQVSDHARALAAACWPGPLTIVVRRAAHVLDEVTGGLDTVGLRVPDQPVALALLERFAGGIAAPSANRFGNVSPTTADAVRSELGVDVDLVLDGGPCVVGVESTIVDCSGVANGDGDDVAILRVGGIAREQIEALLGRAITLHTTGDGARRAPGTLASHYAPRARVELTTGDELTQRVADATAAGARVGIIGLRDAVSQAGGVSAAGGPAVDDVCVLVAPRDHDEYARVLYAALRDADARGLDVVIAVPPSDEGLGAAVADRLRRAAAPRP
ncbi:MAG: L-threonylcarbamoyladenylate synthase [Acidimicrobiia bacterium]